MTAPTIYVAGQGSYFVGHIPALPGCVGSGTTREGAIANARRAFRAYLELLDARGVSVDHWRALDPDTFAVADAPANGLLPEDEQPLEEHEIRDFLHLFEEQRAALIALVERVPQDVMERRPDEKTWSVRQTLEHIMTGTMTTLAKLERWPDDGFGSLQATHRVAFQRLTVLEPADTRGTKTIMGRPQTVRRVMRRLIEHDWEHYRQIEEILAALGETPTTSSR